MHDHYTVSTLKNDLCFTSKLIERYLGEPDKIARNPRYNTGPAMRLFEKARVDFTMESEDCAAALAAVARSRKKRSECIKAGLEKQRVAALAAVNEVEIEMIRHSLKQIIEHVIRRHNERYPDKASILSSPAFLYNGCKRLALDVLTDFHRTAATFKRKNGRAQMESLLRKKVEAVIHTAHPELADFEAFKAALVKIQAAHAVAA